MTYIEQEKIQFQTAEKKKKNLPQVIFLILHKADNPHVLLIFTAWCSGFIKQQNWLEIFRFVCSLFVVWSLNHVQSDSFYKGLTFNLNLSLHSSQITIIIYD